MKEGIDELMPYASPLQKVEEEAIMSWKAKHRRSVQARREGGSKHTGRFDGAHEIVSALHNSARDICELRLSVINQLTVSLQKPTLQTNTVLQVTHQSGGWGFGSAQQSIAGRSAVQQCNTLTK